MNRLASVQAVRVRRWQRWPAWITWVALGLFLLVPGHPLSWVGGLPWGPLALGCAVLLGAGLFAAWPPTGGRWPMRLGLVSLVLAALKLVLALTAPRYGLEAYYYANERFSNDVESSTSRPGTSYTRLDQSLDFGSDEFPLFFFNDSERFNSLGPDRLDRGKNLTWSAQWLGYLNVPSDSAVTIWLTASGPGELALDGRRLLRVDADGRATAQSTVDLSRGPHALEVRYARKKERSSYLQVNSDVDGQRHPLGAPELTAEPYSADRLALDRGVTLLVRGIDVAYLLILAATVSIAVGARLFPDGRLSRPLLPSLERPLLALIPLGFFLQASLPRLDRYGKMVFLGGGQDWLTHETLARDIQFNGPLMTLGKPLGAGALYYAQPLYPYYLALLHTLAGEDYFGVIALQMLGLGVAVVLVYYLAKRLFDVPTALVALALTLGMLVPFELAWIARLLISEALYYWTMPATVLALLALAAGPGGVPAERRRSSLLGRAALAGVLLGLACLVRGPTLLYLPPAALLVWVLLRRSWSRSNALRGLAMLLLAASLLITLVPLRNAVVAGRPVLVASSGGVNLEKFHRPSKSVRLSATDDDPLYDLLAVDAPTREVVEYLRQDPLGYFGSYLPLAAYTLGIGSAINHLVDERPVQLQPELLLLAALYLLAILLVPKARTLEAGLLHAFIAVHFLTMVVFTPYDYENRLVTPMYLFVTIFAAAALTGIIRRCVGRTADWNLVPSHPLDAGRPQSRTTLGGSGRGRTVHR